MKVEVLDFAVCVHAQLLQSCPTLCNPVDYSPPGSPVLGFSRQECWSGLPCPPLGDFPDPGIKPRSPAWILYHLSHQGSQDIERTPLIRFLKTLKIEVPYDTCVVPFLGCCVCVCTCVLSLVRLLAAPWTLACQAPLSMGFSRQDGLPFPSPGDLPDPGIEPESLVSPALAGGFFTTSAA